MDLKLEWVSFFLFALAGLIHILFFVLESFIFQRPKGRHLFGVSEENHEEAKTWAFNQGFYNLFLAIGMFVGLQFVLKGQIMLAGALAGFCAASMVGAGLVLFFSVPRMRRAAVVQFGPPLLGLLFLYFHVAKYF